LILARETTPAGGADAAYHRVLEDGIADFEVDAVASAPERPETVTAFAAVLRSPYWLLRLYAATIRRDSAVGRRD
jgi:hypothetical protein